MSIAAKQCREWVERTFPGVRIGRKACRNTESGAISQHSAYDRGEYDSNAIDIFGPEELPYEEERAFVDEIVTILEEQRHEWSIRLILWNVPDHYGHAHIDFWPTLIDPPKWCGRDFTPTWAYSTGGTAQTRNPAPENGSYDGGDMSYAMFRVDEFDLWTDQNIMDAFDAGMFEDSGSRSQFYDYWVVHRSERTTQEKVRFMTDYYAHLWKRGS